MGQRTIGGGGMRNKDIELKIVNDRIGNRSVIVSYRFTSVTELHDELLMQGKDFVRNALNYIVKESADRIVNNIVGDTRILDSVEARLMSIGDFHLVNALNAYKESMYVSKSEIEKEVADKLMLELQDLPNSFYGINEEEVVE